MKVELYHCVFFCCQYDSNFSNEGTAK